MSAKVTLGMANDINAQIWSQQARSIMPEFVRVIGRVIGRVNIRDIGKEVLYNQVADIHVNDAIRSKDLLQAVDEEWVEVVYGNEFLNRQRANFAPKPQQHQPVQQTQQVQQVQGISTADLKDFATKIAHDAATAAANQSVDSIRSMIGEMSDKIGSGNIDAVQLVEEITKRLPSTQSVQQIQTKNDIIDDASKVFIRIDEDKKLDSNIDGNLGSLTIKKDSKAKSTAKKLKQINKKGDTNEHATS
jgi:hypothetical protein